uniref:CRAL-TRIO domain-containing protein n=1 Tax=Mucochytrium quahogii TaxID=96639 RepID=A0A7S2RJ71_9STRA|mmetsp:Transcript_16934/g.29104  ORF Transcript_16934/g.29104 Transcript_16934/m.29104 type:complete len:904 (-) Transcript_16934:35-2746(-)
MQGWGENGEDSCSNDEVASMRSDDSKRSRASEKSSGNVQRLLPAKDREHIKDMDNKIVRLRDMLLSSKETSDLLGQRGANDSQLRRYIRARDGDVNAAFEQAKKVLHWRKDHKVGEIVQRNSEFVAQDRWGSVYWHGKDIYGRPILVVRGCRHDPSLFGTETTLRFLIWKLEKQLEQSEVDDIVVILDCINMTRHNLDTKMFRIVIPVLLNYYPERLGACLVYPTSQIMWLLWKMVSKTLDDKTEKKFVFIREQKRDNKFLRLIREDQLQERFGGKCNQEFGVSGLALVPPEALEEEDKRATINRAASCVGPGAFELSKDETTDELDPASAIRNHRGSFFDEEGNEEFKQFLDKREAEVDRFQFRLRYQVSHYQAEEISTDSDDTDNLSTVTDQGRSPRSDTGASVRRRDLVRTSASEAGESKRGKRALIKRFIRRHIRRKKTEESIIDDVSIPSVRSTPVAHDDKLKADSMASRQSEIKDIEELTEASEVAPTRKLNRLVSEHTQFLLDKVKFVMEAGASMRKVKRDDTSLETNTWSEVSADKFETRIGPDYKKNRKKATSGPSIYDCVCCDVWTLDSKRPHIASYMQLPDLAKKRPLSKREALAPIPELLIVNMMMPSYQPSGPFSKKRIDGPGQSIVMFAKLSDWAKTHPDDPAVQLWSRFVHVYEEDPFRERLKMITRLENPDEVPLGRIERALASKYNGTPWLVRPEYEFHKGRGYFEIDIDYHLFKYFVLSNALPALDRIHNSILDCALIIQAERDDEMPERVLICATIRNLNLKEAPAIDLVLMDKSKNRPSFEKMGASFIDRDGQVHSFGEKQTRKSVRMAPKSSSRSSAIERSATPPTAQPTTCSNLEGETEISTRNKLVCLIKRLNSSFMFFSFTIALLVVITSYLLRDTLFY